MPEKIKLRNLERIPRLEAKILTPLSLGWLALSNLVTRGSDAVYRHTPPDLLDHMLNSSAHPVLGYAAGMLANKLFARHGRATEIVSGIAGTIAIDIGAETAQSLHDTPGHFIDYLATHATRMETLRDFSAAAAGWAICAAIYWKHPEAEPAVVEKMETVEELVPQPFPLPMPYDWSEEWNNSSAQAKPK